VISEDLMKKTILKRIFEGIRKYLNNSSTRLSIDSYSSTTCSCEKLNRKIILIKRRRRTYICL